MGGGSNEEELGNGHTSCLALYHGVHGARTLHRAGHSISGYGALPEAQECLDQSKVWLKPHSGDACSHGSQNM